MYPVSGKSKEVQSSLRLVKSFDKYTWMLMAISVVVVALAIIHIDRMNAYWKNLTTKDILHQSKVGDGLEYFLLRLITVVFRYFHNYWNDC